MAKERVSILSLRPAKRCSGNLLRSSPKLFHTNRFGSNFAGYEVRARPATFTCRRIALQSSVNTSARSSAMDSITSRMFSLFSSRSQSSLTGDDTPIVDVPPVSGTNIELAADRPGRALKHLIRLSHASHAVLFNHYTFHNHLPHVRGSWKAI